ncbi:hypothetical protein VPH35_026500 [Triticum aestivum]
MEGEEDEDRISHLPDCLLGSIVSLLPIKNAARTMALSRRWRHIWPSVPLDVSQMLTDYIDSSNTNHGSHHQSIIPRILSSHKTTSTWLPILSNRRIDGSLVLNRDLLRPSAGVLRHLELHCCCLDHQPGVDLPLLSLHYLCCLVLRKLQLFKVHQLRRLIPCSRTLVEVYIGPHIRLEEVSFRGTPNLENIVLLYADIWRLWPDIIRDDKLPPRVQKVKSISIITTLILNMKFSDGGELRKGYQHCLAFGWKDKHAFGQWQPAADTITCLNKHLKYWMLLRSVPVYHVLGVCACYGGVRLYQDVGKDLTLKGGKASSGAQVSFEWRSTIATNRQGLESYVRKVSIVANINSVKAYTGLALQMFSGRRRCTNCKDAPFQIELVT